MMSVILWYGRKGGGGGEEGWMYNLHNLHKGLQGRHRTIQLNNSQPFAISQSNVRQLCCLLLCTFKLIDSPFWHHLLTNWQLRGSGEGTLSLWFILSKATKSSHLHISLAKAAFDLYSVITPCYYPLENVSTLVNDGLSFDFWHKNCFIKIYSLIWEPSSNCPKLWSGAILLEVNLVFLVTVIV